MTNLFIIFLLLLILLNLLICFYSTIIAKYFKIIDFPSKGNKKIHLKPTPLIGGLIFFINILLFILFDISTGTNSVSGSQFLFDLRFISFKQIFTFFVVIFLVYLFGFYDDVYDISPSRKTLLFLFTLYLLFISNPNISITVLNFYILDHKVYFNNFSIFLTLFCVLAFMNAANMFDGINLQSAVLYFSFLLIFFIKGIDQRFLFIFLISLIIFSYMNLRGKIFLGNNGSYFLSFLVSIIIICDHNWKQNYFVEEIFLYMLLPGVDMIRLTLTRIIKNRSPFKGDNNHIHHLLVNKFNYNKSIIIIFLFTFTPIILFNFFEINFLILIVIFLLLYMILFIICFDKDFKKINL